MGVLKSLTDEYFGNNIRTEDLIDISDLDVEIVSFKDGKGYHHKHGYKVKDGDEDEMAKTLKELIERVIEKRGNECNLNIIDISNIKKMHFKEYEDIYGIFHCSHFNGDISSWDVSNVEDMSHMFESAENFNQPLDGWGDKLGKVKDMSYMFWNAKSFNQDIGNWNVSGVEDMSGMFAHAQNFNQPLKDWGGKLGKVTNMKNMFRVADNFNQDIGNWNVSSVTSMENMFLSAENFNQPLDGWGGKLGKVTNMKSMFQSATNFNQDIGNWDVSGVVNMKSMFLFAENFNQPLGGWGDKLGKVEDMSFMFFRAKNFDQDLSEWQLKDGCKTDEIFEGCPLEKNPPEWYKE